MKKTDGNDLRERLLLIAKSLDAVIDGKDEFFADYGIDDDDRDEYDDVYSRLSKYFEDVLDVEYRVDAHGEYRGAILTLGLGGPSIYLDTCDAEIRGYWGGDKAVVDVWSGTINPIDEYFAEQWSCVRGW